MVGCSWKPGQFHDYVIAGNVCNAFCLGGIGSSDDFFLVGVEPDADSNFPMLTGNFLSSEGELLFRIVRNVITINPGHCSKIQGDHVGYEIHDSAGVKVFAVRTVYSPGTWHPDSKLKTTIFGNFYDKSAKLVFRANSGEEDERIEADTKYAFGISGDSIGSASPLTEDERSLALWTAQARGAAYQPIRGTFVGEEIDLEGKILINAVLTRCTLHVRSANFLVIGGGFNDCRFLFYDDIALLRNLILAIEASTKGVDDADRSG